MGLRFRDLVTHVEGGGPQYVAAGTPPGQCGCTQTANVPRCNAHSDKPGGGPVCPKASVKPSPKKAGGLEALRRQLRAELTTSG
jgi:hypothetical protein